MDGMACACFNVADAFDDNGLLPLLSRVVLIVFFPSLSKRKYDGVGKPVSKLMLDMNFAEPMDHAWDREGSGRW